MGAAPDATTLLSAWLLYAARPCDAVNDDDDDDAAHGAAAKVRLRRTHLLQICDPVEQTCCKFATPSDRPVANLRPRRTDLLQICDPVE